MHELLIISLNFLELFFYSLYIIGVKQGGIDDSMVFEE